MRKIKNLPFYREPAKVHTSSQIPAVPAGPAGIINCIREKLIIPVKISGAFFLGFQLGLGQLFVDFSSLLIAEYPVVLFLHAI